MFRPFAYLLLGLLQFALARSEPAPAQPWPIKTPIDLSSGFGDMRLNRFHAGVDIRTGGVSGKRIYAPASGYIWRVRMSYDGYGKGLYLKGDDDHFYVFGHLSELAPGIKRPVQKAQFAAERYYVDLYFPKDSIRVSQGDFIGLTGQTGVGAPHLHFEKRTPDNRPINPLTHGFELDDKVRPTFDRIGFHLRDDHSLFTAGTRKLFFPVSKTKQPGQYKLDTLIHLNAPFGILVDCYDQMRVGSMRQSIPLLELYIDSALYYRTQFDTLAFEMGHVVDLTFDPMQAANGDKRVRRLYFRKGQDELVGRVFNDHNGEIGWDSLEYGRHEGLIRAQDSFGNESTLEFEFVWTPSNPLHVVDPAGIAETFSDNAVSGEQSVRILEDGLIVDGTGFVSTRNADSELMSLMASRSHLSDSIYLAQAGSSVVSPDKRMQIDIESGSLYQPRLLGLFAVPEATHMPLVPSSEKYFLEPVAFPLRKPLKVSIKLDPGKPHNKQAGLCWLDEEENEWVWIDEDTLHDDLVAGESYGGGTFAAVLDTTRPTIRRLNLRKGENLTESQPEIRFELDDNLSGFENDQSIDIRIDGGWLIPEYDNETKLCRGTLRGPLKTGSHQLRIAVKDRAGNQTELSRKFYVKQTKSQPETKGKGN